MHVKILKKTKYSNYGKSFQVPVTVTRTARFLSHWDAFEILPHVQIREIWAHPQWYLNKAGILQVIFKIKHSWQKSLEIITPFLFFLQLLTYFLVVSRVPGFDFVFLIFYFLINNSGLIQNWLDSEKISVEFRLDVLLPSKATFPKKFIPERGLNDFLLFQWCFLIN